MLVVASVVVHVGLGGEAREIAAERRRRRAVFAQQAPPLLAAHRGRLRVVLEHGQDVALRRRRGLVNGRHLGPADRHAVDAAQVRQAVDVALADVLAVDDLTDAERRDVVDPALLRVGDGLGVEFLALLIPELRLGLAARCLGVCGLAAGEVELDLPVAHHRALLGRRQAQAGGHGRGVDDAVLEAAAALFLLGGERGRDAGGEPCGEMALTV